VTPSHTHTYTLHAQQTKASTAIFDLFYSLQLLTLTSICRC